MATTAHVPVSRIPFAPLDSPRLQLLASAKNRQNGLVNAVSMGKAALSGSPGGKSAFISSKPLVRSTPTKRPMAVFDESDGNRDDDSENVDPAAFSAKRSKSDGKPSFAFTFSSSTTSSAMPPPSTVPARRPLSTPIRANMSSLRTPLTAPVGRPSPTKRTGIAKPSRRVSAPFARIDPPAFQRSAASSLPFSLDAAISGTLSSSSKATPAATSVAAPGATIAESMPKAWFFDIYEDTPEEAAANLMEHSTLTLDLGSDDEALASKARDDRGKENCPPEGYDAPAASRPVDPSTAVPSTVVAPAVSSSSSAAAPETDVIVRRKVDADAMDDGRRTPLGELEVEIAVEAEAEAALPAVKKSAAKGEIIVWEDGAKAVEGMQ